MDSETNDTPTTNTNGLTAANQASFLMAVLALAGEHGFSLNVKNDPEKNNGKPYANCFISSVRENGKPAPVVLEIGEKKHTAARFSVNVTLFDWDVTEQAKFSKSTEALIKAQSVGKTAQEIADIRATFAKLGIK